VTDIKDIRRQLRKIRRDQELSQDAVSAMAGMPQRGHISQLERGVRIPRFDTMTKWADALGYEIALVEKVKK
jgi:transcriptional regulator with XRE-family HTH domain